jgi:thiamine-monophosphate kinase
VLGGDLSGGDRISLAVTVIGRADRPVGRAGARPGDGRWVSGTLGGARAALRAWQRGRVPDPEARIRFARPEPRIALGAWLAARGASAMLDLSDGLASDARHLARAGNVGLEVDLGLVPIGPGVGEASEADGQSAGEFAARGGEDYELLVTLPAEARMEDPPGGTPLSRIGRVVVGSGVTFVQDDVSLELEGFDHFA